MRTKRTISDKEKALHVALFEYLYPRIGKPQGIVNKIIHYVDDDNYLQILYNYNIDTIQALLIFFLDMEDYDTCAIIRDVVLNHNKATGTNYKLLT